MKTYNSYCAINYHYYHHYNYKSTVQNDIRGHLNLSSTSHLNSFNTASTLIIIMEANGIAIHTATSYMGNLNNIRRLRLLNPAEAIRSGPLNIKRASLLHKAHLESTWWNHSCIFVFMAWNTATFCVTGWKDFDHQRANSKSIRSICSHSHYSWFDIQKFNVS